MGASSEALSEVFQIKKKTQEEIDKKIKGEIASSKKEQEFRKKYNRLLKIYKQENLNELIHLTKNLSNEEFKQLVKEIHFNNQTKNVWLVCMIYLFISLFVLRLTGGVWFYIYLIVFIVGTTSGIINAYHGRQLSKIMRQIIK